MQIYKKLLHQTTHTRTFYVIKIIFLDSKKASLQTLLTSLLGHFLPFHVSIPIYALPETCTFVMQSRTKFHTNLVRSSIPISYEVLYQSRTKLVINSVQDWLTNVQVWDNKRVGSE